MSGGFVGRGTRIAFALGTVFGAAIASAALAWLEPKAPKPVASTPQGHRGLGPGDLESAVRVSTRLLALPEMPEAVGSPAFANAAGQSARVTLARAEDHRRKREFREACELYAAVAADGYMTADAWADYADAQASLTGRIAGDPARSIAASLELDPQHPKALWLQASLAHEEGRYADALAAWKQLLTLIPASTSDARIVEANIAEATRLSAG
jgi:tetratricopeptide (TPR) repeat protein